MTTLEKVAALSGASRSTVSRVINNDPHVSEETRQRVMEVVQRLNYQPNAAARSLAAGRTHVLGLVIPTGMSALFSDPYFPLLIQGISGVCITMDYSVMLWIAEPEHERRAIRQIVYNGLIEGVITSSMPMDDPLMNALRESRIPFVMIGRHPTDESASYVDVDNVAAGYAATVHLLRAGRKRVATITGPRNMIAGYDRLAGYFQALREFDVASDPALVVDGDFRESGGYAAARALWAQRPDAIFAASDAMALGVLRAFREMGVRVPEDVALVGFDDIPLAANTDPPLTTIRQPIQGLGQAAVRALVDEIQCPYEEPQHVVLPTELIVRTSCGANPVF